MRVQQRGIDAVEAIHGLIGADLALVSLTSKDWKTLTPGKLEEKLRSPPAAQTSRTILLNESRGTYGFQTREGGLGILQITDAHLPRGVKIRYRRVQAEMGGSVTEQALGSDNRDPRKVVAETIRQHIRRDLTRLGARYEEVQVTVAESRDSATPFKVSYRGLRNFKWGGGATPSAAGEFIMRYGGGGQWQGELGGIQFSVQVGRTDNFTLHFVNDSQVIGAWESVDFVADPDDFKPERPSWNDELPFKGLTFLNEGKTPQLWWTWTRGFLIHHGDKTASRYEIREIEGRAYLFLEWNSGDVTISGMKPRYYVLKRKL